MVMYLARNIEQAFFIVYIVPSCVMERYLARNIEQAFLLYSKLSCVLVRYLGRNIEQAFFYCLHCGTVFGAKYCAGIFCCIPNSF